MKRKEKFYKAPKGRCKVAGKISIPEEEVDHAVRALQTRNGARAYYCEHCDAYHLTSMPLERAVEMIYEQGEETGFNDRH